MVLTATQVQAQIINSSIWLEGKGRRVLWGCGQNYETTLHIKSSGGSASVTLRLRTVVSGAANLLQVNTGGGWADFNGTLVLAKNGPKTIRVRAKRNAVIPFIGGRATSLGLGDWPTGTGAVQFGKGERWVFEIKPDESQKVIGSTYGGSSFGPRAPGVGVWVVVPNWRDSAQHGCSP